MQIFQENFLKTYENPGSTKIFTGLNYPEEKQDVKKTSAKIIFLDDLTA